MAVNLSPYGGVGAQFFTNNGVPLAGGKIFTYSAGTTTPQATYTSASGVTAHANPIILDAAGRVPGGEIWLTDGLQYKFVLKDANDITLATYDNVVGINSNFINYTNEQEIQTATAGQTVFTLTTMQYQPGTGSLSVFVDGVNQYGPGAQYAFVETDSTTVTFVTGLHVGASVKFTTAAINAASYGDAFQISYTPPFTGSAATNVGDKLAQTVSVKDFGAVGDGVTDDTAAIQAAIAALSVSGGEVFFPQGDYNISATLTLPYNVSLRGTGVRSTLIRQTTLNLPAISVSNGQSHVKDLGVIFAGTPVSGADAILVSGVDNYINNIRIFNGWNGIRFTGSGNKASGLIINNCTNTGLYFTGCGDVYVSDFLVSSGIPTDFSNGGVRLENRAEAILLCNGSILGGTYSIVTGASVYDFNLRPAWSKFTQVYFDAATNGSLLNQLFVSKFVNCWFSGGRSGAGSPGMTLDQSNDVTFESCEFFNSGSHGAFVNNTAVGARFNQCLFADNSVNVAANGGRGLLIAANTNDFVVQGCRATNGLYPDGDQGFGIVVTTGTSDRYIIADNLVSGNALGGVFDGGSGANKRVANNY